MANTITTAASLPPSGSSQERVVAQTASTEPAEGQSVAASGSAAPVASPAQAPQTPPPSQQIERATQDISDYIQSVSRSLQISVDDDLGTTVITVFNSETEEVVRQIPPDEILQIARYIADQLAEEAAENALPGVLFNNDA